MTKALMIALASFVLSVATSQAGTNVTCEKSVFVEGHKKEITTFKLVQKEELQYVASLVVENEKTGTRVETSSDTDSDLLNCKFGTIQPTLSCLGGSRSAPASISLSVVTRTRVSTLGDDDVRKSIEASFYVSDGTFGSNQKPILVQFEPNECTMSASRFR